MRLVYGIDISMRMLEKAAEYAGEKGIENIRYPRSMAEQLPFPDGLFDGLPVAELSTRFRTPRRH